MFYVDDIRVYFKYSIWLLILSQLQASYVCSMQTQFQLIPIPALLHIVRFAKIKARWVKARWQGRLNGTLNRPLAFDTRLKSNIEPELISPMIHTWWSLTIGQDFTDRAFGPKSALFNYLWVGYFWNVAHFAEFSSHIMPGASFILAEQQWGTNMWHNLFDLPESSCPKD